MSVEQDPMVVVLEPAVLGLVQHLAPRGQQVFPNDVRVRINRGVSRYWGTPHSKRFSDPNGGGWLIDLSEQFNDEMLYAVVRSGPGGTRSVVAVVEADDIEDLQRTGKPLPGLGGEEEELSVDVHVTPPVRSSMRPGPLTQSLAKLPEDPKQPMLVVVDAEGHPPARLTQAEVRDYVALLLKDGIEPDQIEIWSSVRKPKVQIAFE